MKNNLLTAGKSFWRGAHLGRRMFFRHAASLLGGYFLLPQRPGETLARAAGTPLSKAKFCVFVFMNGAPSHIDTFDLKTGPWTPAAFDATTFNGVNFPRGLMPRLASQFENVALLRSVKPWVTQHQLGQDWLQIGRNPVNSLSKIAPHIGSVVSLELTAGNARKTLPTFLNLNTTNGPGSGYLQPAHAPFYVAATGGGLGNTRHPDGEAAFQRRFALLQSVDAESRQNTTLDPLGADMEQFNLSARTLMYNADVDRIFTFGADERARYGNSNFGSACITARNLIRADLGTRFIQINIGGWDNHTNIYTGALNAGNANSLGRQFDAGLGTLIEDLRNEGLLDQTLIVAMGEFGRTVGNLNVTNGRDHFPQQTALFAGAGIRGGRALGATDAQGRDVIEPGWKANRHARAEDIEATIYSALGIDWTTIRRDDPLGRGFEYVPFASEGHYEPIHDLWA
jgi:hypothetical protein